MTRLAALFLAFALLLVACETDALPASLESQAPAVKTYVAHLSGDAEVPPVDTRAQGQAVFRLSRDGTELHYRLIVANITDVLASHIHLAPAGQNGPVVAFLFGGGAADGERDDGVLAEGTIVAANLLGPLAGQDLAALIGAIEAGTTYVNVHTVDSRAGEVRGQIR